MLGKQSNLFIIMIILILFVGFANNSHALDLKLVADPPNTTIQVGSEPIAITAEAQGTKLTFQWRLVGEGKLEGDLTGEAVLYFPPGKIEGDSTRALISAKVTDYKDKEATKSITFAIKAKGAVTLEPSQTSGSESYENFIKPTDCSYIKIDGELVGYYASGHTGWRSWGEVVEALKQLKKYKSPEGLIQQFHKDRYLLFRFQAEKKTPLYEVSVPNDEELEFGACWKQVKEIPGYTYTWEGKQNKISKILIYVLEPK